MRYRHRQLQDLIASGVLVELDGQVAHHLESVLNCFPFQGSGINWESVPNHKTLNRTGVYDSAEVKLLIEETAFGNHECAIVFYSPQDPPLAGNRDDILANLDMIF